MPDVTMLCSGLGCPIKGDCAKFDGNNNCPEDCYGIAYFIKPPFVGSSCEHYEHIFRRGKEGEDGSF